MKNCTSYSSYL